MSKNATILTYAGGTILTDAAPGWYAKILKGDDDTTIEEIMGSAASFFGNSLTGGVIAWATPEGGHFARFFTEDEGLFDVHVARAEDWLPFFTAHVCPFVAAQAQLAVVAELTDVDGD